jgi:hypothetical protein
MVLLTESQIPDVWKLKGLTLLEPALEFLVKLGIKPENYLVGGSTCVVFNHGEEVIKLCTRKIDYFHYFKTKRTKDFRDVLNGKFRGLLLMPNKILYDDANYFIYTQDKVKLMNFHDITNLIYIKILEIVKKMFLEDMITPDLISSNFGFLAQDKYTSLLNKAKLKDGEPQSSVLDSTLVLFDYHDMRTHVGYVKYKKWPKVVQSLMILACYLLFNKGFEKQFGQPLSEWKEEDHFKQHKFGEGLFPQHFVDLFHAFSTNDRDIVIHAISNCQFKLAETA